MTKSRTIKGLCIKLRTGDDSSHTSDVMVDDVIVGCEAQGIESCYQLYKELINDKTGRKASDLKIWMMVNDGK